MVIVGNSSEFDKPLVIVALIGSNHAEANERWLKLGVQPKALAKFGFRFRGLPRIHQHGAQGTVGDRQARLVLQCKPEFGCRG